MADALAQFLNCIRTDAKKVNFPILTQFSDHVRKIQHFEDCFDSLNSPDFM